MPVSLREHGQDGKASTMTPEQKLIAQRDRYVAAVRDSCLGRERELLVSLVRGLDVAAFNLKVAAKSNDPDAGVRLHGAATALRPLLEVVRGMPGPLPWSPTDPRHTFAIDNHLRACGWFSIAIRWAAMERYGMATTRFDGDERIVIDVVSDVEERAEREAAHDANDRSSLALQAQFPNLQGELREVRRRLTRYGKVVGGWFIGYDNDQFLLDHYNARARIRAAGIVEAEALPANGMIGGRPFGDWTEASTTACGLVLHHVDAACRLHKRKPKVNMRDILTIYARRDDILDVLVERGNSEAQALQLMAGLTLDGEGARYSEDKHEIPLPYYIDAGEHFVLLPMFGALMNPHAGLLEHLRREYRPDWDRIVDGREDTFREDLRRLLPESRYKVLEKGLRLRRKDKSVLTDVDAIVLDRQTGVLVLIQLKWYDVYGFSLAERESRKQNLLSKGNEWVEKVHGWIDGRSCAEISKAHGWGEAANCPPQLLVMARHASQFAGETRYDPRATWTSWHALSEAMSDPACHGFAAAIALSRSRKLRFEDQGGTTVIEVPGMSVEVRVSGNT